MKTLKTAAPAALALAALLATATLAADRRESRPVPAFDSVGLAAPIRVDVVQGGTDSVALEGDAEALADLETVVEQGTLQIRVRRGADGSRHRFKARAYVSARRVEGLAVSGSGDIRSGPLDGKALRVSVSGSGDVRIEGGRVEELTARIAGSGDVEAARLQAGRVAVSVAGSGDATVWARESLDVRVAGSGDVRYYGDATPAIRIAGSGDVRRLGPAP